MHHPLGMVMYLVIALLVKLSQLPPQGDRRRRCAFVVRDAVLVSGREKLPSFWTKCSSCQHTIWPASEPRMGSWRFHETSRLEHLGRQPRISMCSVKMAIKRLCHAAEVHSEAHIVFFDNRVTCCVLAKTSHLVECKHIAA